MNRLRVTVPALVAMAALAGFAGGPAYATAGPVPAEQAWESVSVSGTGKVFGEPDVVTVSFGVETTAATVAAALEQATTAATRMRDALVRAGMARADLQTSNVDVGTKQDDDEKIIGYSVNQGLTATIRDVPRAGTIMSAAIAAGGDAARMNSVSFGIENDSALLAEARRKAFADARVKAEVYAREAGRPLGRVLRVSEQIPGHEGYGGAGGQDKMLAYAAVPVEPGRHQLTVTVTAEWALQPAA